ncbi:MAG: DNA primase [Streptococcaceae bacterium]|nr:DNA primase [Streptococcaceae bacterium]
MAQTFEQTIEQIKSQVNIVNLISHYVKLDKRGKNYLGLCPFHGEKTPSFNVSLEKGFYHCYGCKRSGDAITFIEEMENLSFREALGKIAELEDIAIDLPQQAPTRVILKEETDLIEMHALAATMYHHFLLNMKEGEDALNYLLNRGLTDKTIATFQIGFAPNERQFLLRVFEKKGYSYEQMKASNLIAENDKGQLYDRFAGRITFPIRNERGQVIAFSARKRPELDSDKQIAKYVNSTDTKIYEKKNTLFNFDLAKRVMKKSKEVFLFEGQMDVIAAFQAGIENSIATLGTALTDIQLNLIAKTVEKIVLVYDGDNAGITATHRAIELLEKTKLSIGIVNLPAGLDPDDYVREYGAENLNNLLTKSQLSVFSYKKLTLKKEYNLKNEQDVISYVSELIKELAKIDSVLEVNMYLNEIHTEFPIFSQEVLVTQLKKMREEILTVEIPQVSDDYYPPSFPDENYSGAYYEQSEYNEVPFTLIPPIKELSAVEKAQQQLLFRSFYERSVQTKLREIPDFTFAHENYQKIFVLLESYTNAYTSFVDADFLGFVQDQELKSLTSEILLLSLPQTSEDGEIEDLLKKIGNYPLKPRILHIKEQLLQAERSGNKERAMKLLKEYMDLQRLQKQMR